MRLRRRKQWQDDPVQRELGRMMQMLSEIRTLTVLELPLMNSRLDAIKANLRGSHEALEAAKVEAQCWAYIDARRKEIDPGGCMQSLYGKEDLFSLCRELADIIVLRFGELKMLKDHI